MNSEIADSSSPHPGKASGDKASAPAVSGQMAHLLGYLLLAFHLGPKILNFHSQGKRIHRLEMLRSLPLLVSPVVLDCICPQKLLGKVRELNAPQQLHNQVF
ncbi:hypothetical protein CsSME_00045476 [Camellia sinensis var. sinensis]